MLLQDIQLPAIDFDYIKLYHELYQFLSYEALLLSERKYDDWLALFTDDAVYEVPIRVTRERGAAWDLSPTGRLFDDTKETLAVRIARLNTEYAWAEDPPSRVRYYLSNLLITSRSNDLSQTEPEVTARYNVLVIRTRGELADIEFVSTHRQDRLRRTQDGWRIAHRTIIIDHSVLQVRNLSFFL